MIVTKQQLVNGAASFVLKEVVPAVNDTALKAVIVAGTKLIQQSDAAVNSILGSGIMKTLLPEDNGVYDVTALLGAIRSTLAECGVFPVTISPIPLILREEKTLTFGVSDVDALQRHIQEAANG